MPVKSIPELDEAIAKLIFQTAVLHRLLVETGLDNCLAAEVTEDLCEIACEDALKVLRDYAQQTSVETCLQYIEELIATKGMIWTPPQQYYWSKTADPEGYKTSKVYQDMLHRN